MFIAAKGPDNTAVGNVILIIATRIARGKIGKWEYDKSSVDMASDIWTDTNKLNVICKEMGTWKWDW